jgi:hypothetical protein
VLEGPQGIEKSSSIRILASHDWFTDALTLGADPKVMIEQTRGKWVVEIPELGGMTNKDVESVNAQLSRQTDRARPAYGRTAVEVPRQFILVGTNNPEAGVGYLKDTTGNRRFLPVRVKGFDLKALARDRDQLWAEAAHAEATYGDLALPRELWAVAAHIQESRRQKDPLEIRLADAIVSLEGFIPTEEIYNLLGLAGGRDNAGVVKRRTHHDRLIALVMKNAGWKSDRKCPRGDRQAKRGYAKGANDTWWKCFGDKFCDLSALRTTVATAS